MNIVESIQEMQQLVLTARGEGRRVGLVPTMGYLHQGHASLMAAARKNCELLITSIFVNPTQFGAGEDFEKYPRDMERDCRLATSEGVDIIFAPNAAEMYPSGFQTYVNVEGLTDPLCGASRPGHFRGVTTVVTKLFTICQPHSAYFGKKDFQQLAVIRRMTQDLNLPVEIIGMPIVRESDGLAMSSRNAYLSSAERENALCLSNAIKSVRAAFRAGESNVSRLREAALTAVETVPTAQIDYIELRNSITLNSVVTADNETLLALAVKIGKTRLIDNCVLGEEN